MSVGEYICLCRDCQSLFDLSVSPVTEETGIKCPACGSVHIERIPSWAPKGLNLYKSLSEWEYACLQCKATFKLPVPQGPLEEQEVRCPECGSMSVERLTVLGVEVPPYCG